MKPLTDWEQRELFVRAELPSEADPIWGERAHVYDAFTGNWVVVSDRSGSYRCSITLRESLSSWDNIARAKLTTWISEQNRQGIRFPAITSDVLFSSYDKRPMRFSKRVARFFEYLAYVNYRPGDLIIPYSIGESVDTIAVKHTIMRWTEVASDREYSGLLQALISDGLLFEQNTKLQLTAKGLNRLDELDADGAAADQAFVAMWFDPSMEEAFEEGIVPGLADVGYRAFRIDRKEHANKIDDEIIAEIRRSNFLIADFTCGMVELETGAVGIPRGGVYYEAGFAQGLGMQVIWTVRQDQIGLVHFDTRQFNHIAWTDPADLRLRLSRQVAAVLGDRKSRT